MCQVRWGGVPRCPTSPASHCAGGVPRVLLGVLPKGALSLVFLLLLTTLVRIIIVMINLNI